MFEQQKAGKIKIIFYTILTWKKKWQYGKVKYEKLNYLNIQIK